MRRRSRRRIAHRELGRLRAGHARLAVDPAYRRRGIATRLVEELERRQRALGAERSSICVFHDEDGAAAFWTALGYLPEPDESVYAKGLG